ncbi:MAG: glycosyltransferase family 1 protein, partial [Syntrophobacteraceae bacterium]|nr:glycosyltransferase family 1 protein [Syntrophobacteraceae bacterium]
MVSVHSSPIGRLGTKDTGGMSVYIRELARELGRRGHAVDIFTRSQDPQSREIVEISPGVSVIHLKAGPREPLNPLAIFPHLPDFLRALHHFKAVHRLHYHL